MNWKKKLIVQENLIERDLGDETVIMTPDGKEIHSFDKTALWIWSKIKKGILPDDIISQLLEEYSVEENTARSDFQIFVDELRTKLIIK